MMRANVRFISVFCNNTQSAIPRYQNLVKQLGKELVKNNLGLVCNGNEQGLMRILTDSVLDVGGDVIGIVNTNVKKLPSFNDKILRVIEAKNEMVYKNTLNQVADGFIGLPGLNSLEELTNIVINSNVGKENNYEEIKPCVLFNVDGFFNGFKNQLSRCLEEGFISPKHFSAIYFTDQIRDSLTFINKYEPLSSSGNFSVKNYSSVIPVEQPVPSMHALVNQMVNLNKKITPPLAYAFKSHFFQTGQKKEESKTEETYSAHLNLD